METSPQFERVIGLPHRRHAFGVNAPGLFRHIGFRTETPNENPLTAATQNESDKLRDDLIQKINSALSELQKHQVAQHACSFCRSGESRETHRLFVSETMLIELKTPPGLRGWRLRFRLDIYDEGYFITLILDQKNPEEGPDQRAAEICDIERRLSDHPPDRPALTESATKNFLDTYYSGIWTSVDNDIGKVLSRFPGSRFTEFRGMALRELTNPLRQPNAKSDIHKIFGSTVRLIADSRNHLNSWITQNHAFVSEVLQLPQWAGKIDQDANCILSGLLGGCAIYFSSVRLTHIPTATAEPAPLRYFILYNGLSKYQLGRLIRRTHVLGELRCAAVLDMDLLDDASTAIRSLGNHIDKLLASGATGITDNDLRLLQAELNKIGSSKIAGGLLYRVNRSRYYASTFRQVIEEMRVQALEGWQSYSEFFRRNLYPQFELIDQIGHRYEVVAERVNRLTNARNAEKLNEFETNSLNLVSRMNDFNAAMVRIQDLGEWIGITAFTYYGGHILSTFFKVGPKMLGLCSLVERHAGQSCADWVKRESDDFFFVGMILAFVAAIMFRMWWHRKRRVPTHGPGNSSAVRPATR